MGRVGLKILCMHVSFALEVLFYPKVLTLQRKVTIVILFTSCSAIRVKIDHLGF